jgi:hypothetical protein
LYLQSFSQEKEEDNERKIVQFTGVVFADDSLSVLPGVHVYIPKGGRGTTTNPYGFFSLPVLEGDSVIFSAVGFERAYFIIPKHEKESSLKKLIYLQEDVTYLQEVEVFPFPSEETFKAAVLAVELPDQQKYDNLNKWVNSEVMQKMYWELPAIPQMNHRYYMQQQMDAQVYKVQPPSNPLLNPFAWATFIRSLNSGN